jgi:hypothetical protein
MKTREIDVWVNTRRLDHVYLTVIPEAKGFELIHRDRSAFVKAKLIIEIPEKKIEITESQFDDVWNACYNKRISLEDFRDIVRKALSEIK